MDGEIRSSGKHWTTAKSFMAECTPLVEAWIRYAEDDWRGSLILIDAGGHQRNVCFHLQQCLEKLFNAELMRMEQPVPKVHNLRELSDLLHQADQNSRRSEQIAELLRGQACIASNSPHGDGIDRVMPWDHQSPLAIAHDQVA